MVDKVVKDYFFVGIDQSLTNTGIVVLNNRGKIEEQFLLQTKSDDLIEKRYTEIKKGVSFIPNIVRLVGVNIEGLSFMSPGGNGAEKGALQYIIRVFLYESNVRFYLTPPKTLKKYVTGKGNSKKENMLLNVYKKWGIEFEDNNLCDAFSLSVLLKDLYDSGELKDEFLYKNITPDWKKFGC